MEGSVIMKYLKVVIVFLLSLSLVSCGYDSESGILGAESSVTDDTDNGGMLHTFDDEGCYVTHNSVAISDYKYETMSTSIFMPDLDFMEKLFLEYNERFFGYSQQMIVKGHKLSSVSYYQELPMWIAPNGQAYRDRKAYTLTLFEITEVIYSETDVSVGDVITVVEYYYYKPDENGQPKYSYAVLLQNCPLEDYGEYLHYLQSNPEGVIKYRDDDVVIHHLEGCWQKCAVYPIDQSRGCTFPSIRDEVNKKYNLNEVECNTNVIE
jgi:hypothetical protein